VLGVPVPCAATPTFLHMNRRAAPRVHHGVSSRILYFPGPILPETDEADTSDVVEAAKIASGKNPHLIAEIWIENRKAAICRPGWDDPFRGQEVITASTL
jgi:hypothetical protein